MQKPYGIKQFYEHIYPRGIANNNTKFLEDLSKRYLEIKL